MDRTWRHAAPACRSRRDLAGRRLNRARRSPVRSRICQTFGLGSENHETGASTVHEVLERAATALGVVDRLEPLRTAAHVSSAFVNEAKVRLRESAESEGLDLTSLPLDVVAFGSYARAEASGESDFDYLVIAHGLCEDPRATRLLLKQADLLRYPEADQVLFEDDRPGRVRRSPVRAVPACLGAL